MAENRTGLFGRIRKAFSQPTEKEERSFANLHMGSSFPFVPTTTGFSLSEDGALAVSAVYACVNKISSTIASMDLHLYERDEDGKRMVNAHPSLFLLDQAPNQYFNPFQFFQHLVSDSLIHGCGYAEIKRNGAGDPISLEMISPTKMRIKTVDGRRMYIHDEYSDAFYSDDLLVIECFRGLSPIREHMENITLGYAAQMYGSTFFGSGGNMSGVLHTDKILTEEQYNRLMQTWDAKYHGMNAAHSTAVLEAGLRYERVGIPPDQCQFLETRKYQVEEVCRIFNVPTSMVQMDANVKYSNQEQQDLFFAKHTIAPWLRNIEQELNRKLLKKNERNTRMFKFNMMSLMRGDMQARANYYQTLLSSGVFSINEVRAMEDKNKVDQGDQHLVQVNQIPLDSMAAYAASITGVNTTEGDG